MGRGCIKKLPHTVSSLHSGIIVLVLQIQWCMRISELKVLGKSHKTNKTMNNKEQ